MYKLLGNEVFTLLGNEDKAMYSDNVGNEIG